MQDDPAAAPHLIFPAGQSREEAAYPLLLRRPGHEAQQRVRQKGLRRAGVSRQAGRSGSLRGGEGPYPDSPDPQIPHRIHRVHPAPPDPVDGRHYQGVARSKPSVQRMPAGPSVGADAARDAHVPIDSPRGAAGASLDSLPVGSDLAVSVFHGFYHLSRTIRL